MNSRSIIAFILSQRILATQGNPVEERLPDQNNGCDVAENTKLRTLTDNLPENTMLNSLRQLLPQTVAWDIAADTFES